MLSVFLLLGLLSSSWADQVWEFVDGDGVTHIGNVPPSAASRGVIWLNRVQPASVMKGKDRGPSALQFSGYDDVKQHLEAAAVAQSLDPAFVIAVAAAESAFNVKAVSRKGALGLMQVMPATAERYGVAARPSSEGEHAAMEPKVNAQIGTRYLADLLRMFDGDKELALAAYNAGEGAVIKHGRRIPPYPETQQYVEKVMRFYRGMLR
ncbi:lytic transglycosylase domain-containing protein [Acidovorax radicis]|uniref:lytic transglycosylase domain-containing protein n=1 Tax=Acidovorax radicis TaxID=758826 RepID=UPI000496C274|nr:lytic transglycosylase domain-containing protein [Acidovorax radicis]